MSRVRRSPEAYQLGLRLADCGMTVSDVARVLDVPRGTLQNWLVRRPTYLDPSTQRCQICAPTPMSESTRRSYAYLFGLYLGDGSISESRRNLVYRLGITLDDRYPGIIEECATAMAELLPNRVNLNAREGCTMVNAYSKHWPCYFPQHGPGMKHDRDIALLDWQIDIVDEHPELFLRGLIHSDGCRVTNRVRGGRYAYPRYFFTNHSTQISALFQRSCDRLGVRWTVSGWHTSVARSECVARLDSFIGPKR